MVRQLDQQHTHIDALAMEQEDVLLGLREEEKLLENETVLSQVVQDDGVYFYKIHTGDTLYAIHNKLKQLPQFAYLDDPWYDPTNKYSKIRGRNIKPEQLRAGFQILIPLPRGEKVLENIDFESTVSHVLTTLSKNKRYSELGKSLLNMPVEDVTHILETFTIKESNKGINALSRWEEWHKAYSYTWFHFLFDEGSPFLLAKDALGYSTGEILSDFSKAAEVFFAGLYEKYRQFDGSRHKDAKGNKVKPMMVKKYVNMHFPGGMQDMFKSENVRYLARMYNGLNAQGEAYADDFVVLYKKQQKSKGSVSAAQHPNTTPSPKISITSQKKPIDIEKELGRTLSKENTARGYRIQTLSIPADTTEEQMLEYDDIFRSYQYEGELLEGNLILRDITLSPKAGQTYTFVRQGVDYNALLSMGKLKKISFLSGYELKRPYANSENKTKEHAKKGLVAKPKKAVKAQGELSAMKGSISKKYNIDVDKLFLVDEFGFALPESDVTYYSRYGEVMYIGIRD